MSDKKVAPYSDPVRPRKELKLRTFEYEVPFNYENVVVQRIWQGGEQHGMEMNPTNTLCTSGNQHIPGDGITITEDAPIVRVEVVGSACTPPGFIMLESEPIEGWRRPDEVAEVMPTRFRVDGLWGMHLRVDQWAAKKDEGFEPYQGKENYPKTLPDALIARGFKVKAIAREFPFAGMSCAVFSIPPSKKVTIMGGGTSLGWHDDNWPDDVQYSFRIIRVTVMG